MMKKTTRKPKQRPPVRRCKTGSMTSYIPALNSYTLPRQLSAGSVREGQGKGRDRMKRKEGKGKFREGKDRKR